MRVYLGENTNVEPFYKLSYWIMGCVGAWEQRHKWDVVTSLYTLIYHSYHKPNESIAAIKAGIKMRTWIEPHYWEHVGEVCVDEKKTLRHPKEFYEELKAKKEKSRSERHMTICDVGESWCSNEDGGVLEEWDYR